MMRTMGLIHLIYVILAVQEGSNDISITFNFPDTYFHQDNFCLVQNRTCVAIKVCTTSTASDCKYRLMMVT